MADPKPEMTRSLPAIDDKVASRNMSLEVLPHAVLRLNPPVMEHVSCGWFT
jgi:hypothetical protein